MNKIVGSCKCGAVRFNSNAPPRIVVNCHCGMCRKLNGSAFSSYVVVPRRALEIVGNDAVASYQVAPSTLKHYCMACGTPLFNENGRYAGVCMLYLGAINEGDIPAPSLNVYSESMLPWLGEISSIETLERGVEE